ncbi:hypothetical protein AA313_de0205911 [Arthrobotrys entomopaga]|nr:hypothetical protein AA313_de0205911 [Arthrobotrys entomopaga]
MAEHQLLDYLRVLHDFDARSPDELTLKKNAKIELLERDEEYNDGWYLVRSHFAPSALLRNAFEKLTALIDKQVAPDSDVVPPPAYSSAAAVAPVVETKQEIPKRLSVTPSELTLDEAKFGGAGSIKEMSVETPPLTLENNMEKRRASEDFKRENPHIQMLSRSPVVEDTLSDIEEALSEIRTAPRSVGSHAHKKKQPLPIMETSEAPPAVEHDFDDSGSDYSRNAFDPNESTASIGISNQPSVSGYLETRPGYAGRSRESALRQGDHPLQFSQQFVDVEESSSDDEAVEILYSADEIRTWTPAQVSAYFQEQHLPLNICDKFEEQEISGSILLQLEMAHLKELEIGSFGKRFEVWKEIEKLQSMVRMAKGPGSPGGDSPKEMKARNRSSSTPAGVLPRLPSLHNRPPARGGSLAVPSSHEEGMFDQMGIIRGEKSTSIP